MELRLKIKPSKYSGRTFSEAKYKSPLRYACFTLSSCGQYHKVIGNSIEAIVYTAQKFRGKRSDKPEERVTHWEIHVYKIPLDVLRSLGLEVVQEKRTFKLIKK